MVFVPMASTECNSLNPIPSHCHSPICTNHVTLQIGVWEHNEDDVWDKLPTSKQEHVLCRPVLPFCPLYCWLSSHPRCIKMLGLCFCVYVRCSQGPRADPAKDIMPRACRRGQGLPSNLPKRLRQSLSAFGCYWLYVRRSQGLARGQSKGGSCKKATWAFPEMAYTKFMATCMLHFLESYPESYPRKHWTGKGRRWTPVFFCGCASNAPRFAQGQSKGGSCKRAQDP